MPLTSSEQVVKDLYDACNERDLKHFLSVLHPDVEWELPFWLGGGVRRGRESLSGYMHMLDEHAAHWELKEVLERGDQVIARHEGTAISVERSVSVGGAGFRLFSIMEDLVIKATPYAYRKDLLDALELVRSERQGLLTVRDEADERLYHFGIDPGAEMTWASYAELGTSDHDHCEMCWATFSTSTNDQQEGYATLDGCCWLCPDCFDEVKDHFRLRLTA